MKTLTIKASTVLACALLGGAALAAGASRVGAVEKDTAELLAIEAQLAAAIAKDDPVAVARWLDDDWMIIDSDGGSVDKTRFLRVPMSGDLAHLKTDTRNPRVRIYGNTAIVTNRTATQGTFKGSLFTTDEFATDFLVKKKGRWPFVFSQLTRANDAP